MATVLIRDRGCRGCSLCVDLCPVGVFVRDDQKNLARVTQADRCIGCLTCAYACPSQCIEIDDYLRLRPFHRIEEHSALMRRFLQEQPLADSMSAEDVEEAWRDVAARLIALSDTVIETIGKGHKAVGRRSGAIAAAHLPEMYEASSLEEVLAALRHRFAHAFSFDFTTDGPRASLRFQPCGLCRVVQSRGDTVGEAVLCQLFHEYWAGLFSAFVGTSYRCTVPVAGEVCEMELTPAS